MDYLAAVTEFYSFFADSFNTAMVHCKIYCYLIVLNIYIVNHTHVPFFSTLIIFQHV